MFDHNFNQRFEQSQRRFDLMFRIVATVIALTFLAIVSFWIFAGVLAYKSVDAVQDKGARGVLEQIWCGKDKDCKLP